MQGHSHHLRLQLQIHSTSLPFEIPTQAKIGLEWATDLAVRLAVASVSERSKDGAGALIDHLTNVHGERENKDEKEEIDAK
jgi:hypothetical protein